MTQSTVSKLTNSILLLFVAAIFGGDEIECETSERKRMMVTGDFATRFVYYAPDASGPYASQRSLRAAVAAVPHRLTYLLATPPVHLFWREAKKFKKGAWHENKSPNAGQCLCFALDPTAAIGRSENQIRFKRLLAWD